jgi:hypothetical protein
MRHVVLIPERFCLGDVISFKARRVPSIKCDRLTVCCPEAWEFIFPTATDFVHVDERLDGHGERAVVETLKGAYPGAEFIRISREYEEAPGFFVQVPDRQADRTDVLTVPRKKPNSSGHRDWGGWNLMAHDLQASGLTIKAVGKADMSFDCGIPIVEDLRDIAAHMLKTRFVVSTDSGLAHLAILLRVPLIVLWGSPVGVIPGQSYKQGCHGRMEAQKSGFVHHIEGAWGDPAFAVREVLKIVL